MQLFDSVHCTLRRRVNPLAVCGSLNNFVANSTTAPNTGQICAHSVLREENLLYDRLAYHGIRFVDCGQAKGPDEDFSEDYCAQEKVNGKHVAIIGRMACPERQQDAEWVHKWMKGRRITCLGNGEFPADATIEFGDVIAHNGHRFVGISERTNAQGRSGLRNIYRGTTVKMIEVEVHKKSGPHLDNFASIVGDRLALVDHRHVDADQFRRTGYEVIQVAEDAEWGLAAALRIPSKRCGTVVLCQGKDEDPHIQEMKARGVNVEIIDYRVHRLQRQAGPACKLSLF